MPPLRECGCGRRRDHGVLPRTSWPPITSTSTRAARRSSSAPTPTAVLEVRRVADSRAPGRTASWVELPARLPGHPDEPTHTARPLPLSGGKSTRVERHKHRVKAGGRPPGALAGGLNRALPDHLGVAGGHTQAVAANALRSDGQVVPSSAAAAFTLPSRSARAKARSASARPGIGWAASPLGCWACKAPLVAPGDGSTSRRWVDRLQRVAESPLLFGVAWCGG